MLSPPVEATAMVLDKTSKYVYRYIHMYIHCLYTVDVLYRLPLV